MRLALHTIICCCVITAVLPVPVKDATRDTSLKKRIRAWLQNHMKVDMAATEQPSDPAGVQRVENVETTSPPPSSGLSVRHKRAASLKASGCVLFMCTYHELLYRLHHIYNKQKAKTAPESKIRSTGYGRRRRRSVEDDTETLLQSETGEQDSEEALPLCGYNICTAAAA